MNSMYNLKDEQGRKYLVEGEAISSMKKTADSSDAFAISQTDGEVELEINDASIQKKGLVQLSDALTSAATDKAATPNAVRQVKESVDELRTVVDNLETLKTEVVDELPTEGQSGVLYFVPAQNEQGGNTYEEYIWVASENRYEQVGSTGVDLGNYVTLDGEQTITGAKTIATDTIISPAKKIIFRNANGAAIMTLSASGNTATLYGYGLRITGSESLIIGQPVMLNKAITANGGIILPANPESITDTNVLNVAGNDARYIKTSGGQQEVTGWVTFNGKVELNGETTVGTNLTVEGGVSTDGAVNTTDIILHKSGTYGDYSKIEANGDTRLSIISNDGGYARIGTTSEGVIISSNTGDTTDVDTVPANDTATHLSIVRSVTPDSDTEVLNRTENDARYAKIDGVVEEQTTTVALSFAYDDNGKYIKTSTSDGEALTVSVTAPTQTEDDRIVTIHLLLDTTGSTSAPSITWDSSITWLNNVLPTIDAGYKHMLSFQKLSSTEIVGNLSYSI